MPLLRRPHGLTLLELLVAVTLMSLAVVAAYKGMAVMTKRSAYQASSSDANTELRQLMDEVKRQFESRLPGNGNFSALTTTPFDPSGGCKGLQVNRYDTKTETNISVELSTQCGPVRNPNISVADFNRSAGLTCPAGTVPHFVITRAGTTFQNYPISVTGVATAVCFRFQGADDVAVEAMSLFLSGANPGIATKKILLTNHDRSQGIQLLPPN